MTTQGNIWEAYNPGVILAPMDDVTDLVFRQLVEELAPADFYMTEFANADGWCSPGRHAVERRVLLGEGPGEKRVIAQIWGLHPENFRQFARDISGRGFVGIDLNMGCPVRDVVRKGACSGLIGDPGRAAEIIAATKAGAPKLPVSVKTRLGKTQIDMGWIEHLLRQDIAALSVHLRTVKELSKVPAHWEVMPELVRLRDKIAPQTKLYGNGDVENRPHALRLIEQAGCDGVMIGRGIFHDPWAFEAEPREHSLAERTAALRRHLEIWETTLSLEDQQRRFEPLKRFFKIYISGFDGAAELRTRLMECRNLAAVRDVLI